MHNKSAVLYLYEQGYRQKLICLITGYNQSFISKNCNNPRNYIPTFANANDGQIARKFVVDRLLECRVLRKFDSLQFNEQDRIYIKLLDFMLVDRDNIRKLYRTTSGYKVAQALRAPKEIIKNFDPDGLSIPHDAWQLVLEQIFKSESK